MNRFDAVMSQARYRLLVIPLIMSLFMFFFWYLAFAPDCAFGQAECPVSETAVYTDNLAMRGETAFTATIDISPTANGTYTIPDSAGNDTFVLADTAATRA